MHPRRQTNIKCMPAPLKNFLETTCSTGVSATLQLQPYSTWDLTTVTVIALQVASVALFLFFGGSFIVELHRFRRSLKQER